MGTAALENSGIMRLHPRAVRLLPLLLPVLLLPVRGEAYGERLAAPGCVPSPTQVSTFAAPNLEITELAAAGTTLFFIARDGASYGLWASRAGQAPMRMEPIATSPWPDNVSSVKGLTAVGERLFFVVAVELSTFLWATDDTHTGIYQVGVDSFSGATLLNRPEFTVLGSTLFFKADHLGEGPKLWRSNGTSVELVQDASGNGIIDPSGLAVLNGKLFFMARYAQGRNGLWMSEEAQGTAGLVTDFGGTAPSYPSSMIVVGDRIYFTAVTTSLNADLWVSDGTEAGTEMVAGDGTLGASHGPLSEFTAVGDKLFFHMEGESGDELWVSEGPNGRTEIVKELQVGPSGGNPVGLTAVGRVLFFMANDGQTGREPWRSDGTAAGTFLVREFVTGSANPSQSEELKAGPGVLVLSIYEDATGTELWSISETDAVRLTDIVPGGADSNPHGMTILGDRLYFAARARLSDQGQELFFLELTEVDCNDPVVECPGPLEVEAVSSMGALVFLPAPRQMSDDSFTPLTVSYSPASPEIFPLDTPTSATITVSDRAGRTATCSFPVTVRDTTGPDLVCPEQLIAEAEDATGANVFLSVVARDAVSSVSVSSSRASGEAGTHFELNRTDVVEVTATDGSGNQTRCSFPVTVRDTQPPKLTCPADIVHMATSAEPVPISYTPPEPDDKVDAVLLENSEHPPSGSLFNLGTTEVELTAVDTSGNSATCSFSVHIVDSVAPTITCPGPQQVVATGPEGAVVEFPEAVAEGGLATPTIRYSAEPGSTFPPGETTVTATASDQSGNEASCSFTVTVTASGEESPLAGCGCRAGSASASVYWLLLALAPLWARRRAGRLAR